MGNVIESILNAEDLPSPPGVVLRLLEIYNDPNVEVDEFAEIIGADPALTTKLIEYANSPLFARQREVATIQNAIVLVGMRAVKILALSFSLVKIAPNNRHGFDYDHFWSQSLATAAISKTIGMVAGGTGDQEFLLGLILRVGEIGLVQTFSGTYLEMLERATETGESIYELEQQEWSLNHVGVSAALLKQWHFPSGMVEAVSAFGAHSANDDWDEESLAHESLSHESMANQMRVLKLAQQMCDMLFNPNLHEDQVTSTQKLAADWFGVEGDEFSELFDRATEAWTDFAKLLNFRSTEAQNFEELENRARKGMSELSMGLHAETIAMHEENVELQYKATIDSLTGLKNRRAFFDEANAERQRAMRVKTPFVLMMVDIDHFKNVNDKYGHAVGDLALVTVAKELMNNGRQYDSVYRIGGEEFVILVPECDVESAIAVADRYRKSIESLVIKTGNDELKITASFGVAVHDVGHPRSLESLLEAADQLLYQAKEEGRNRVCCEDSKVIRESL